MPTEEEILNEIALKRARLDRCTANIYDALNISDAGITECMCALAIVLTNICLSINYPKQDCLDNISHAFDTFTKAAKEEEARESKKLNS